MVCASHAKTWAQVLDYSDTPSLYFLQNNGQLHDEYGRERSDIQFSASIKDITYFFGDNGFSIQFERTLNAEDHLSDNMSLDNDSIQICRIDLKASFYSHGLWSAQDTLAQFEHHYVQGKPFEQIPCFESLKWENEAHGIRLDHYFRDGELKFDVVLAAGIRAEGVRWKVEGAEKIEILPSGELLLYSANGPVMMESPIAFQDSHVLEAEWVIEEDEIWIDVPHRDLEQELLIDPISRQWGTYYGGNKHEDINGSDTDPLGNIYIAGMTQSLGNLATSGAHQQTLSGQRDAFLAKFNAYGQRLWCTYYGGSGLEAAQSCATDEASFVYICGFSTSTSGIATNNAHQTTKKGPQDAFLAKFDQSGLLEWATYYGGNAEESGSDCEVDLSGKVYLAGHTDSPSDISTTTAHQITLGGNVDGFLVQFDGSGQRQWGTYYGGTGEDRLTSVSTSRSYVYVCGMTDSQSDIASLGVHQESFFGGIKDAFAVKFDGLGNRQWGSYFGGLSEEEALSCVADGRGNLYTAGYTSSATHISSSNVFQELLAGSYDAFLTKFDPYGSVVWASYFGGKNWDRGTSCALDANNNVYLAGYCRSDSGIASPNAYQDFLAGKYDGFLARFDTLGAVIWSTYYGGTSYDYANSCSADPNGAIYLTGQSWSNYVLSSPGSQQNTINTGPDGFLAKFIQCAPSTGSMSATSCWSYTSPSGAHLWTASGSYKDTIVNSTGCDSVIDINLTIIQGPSKTINANACNYYVSPSGSEIWDSSGVYQDFVPNPFGCDSMIIVNLSLQYGPRDTISAQGCNAYLSPSGDHLWVQSGWYTDYLPNPSGCDSIITIDLTVFPLELHVIKDGATLTAIAAPATYQWLDCNANFIPIPGATSQSYTSDVAGAFAVVVGQNGCTDTSVCYTITEANVGITEYDPVIRIYPNPNQGAFELDGVELGEIEEITLLDARGRIIPFQSTRICDFTYQFFIDTSPGKYWLLLRSTNGEQWQTPVVVH